jgi:rRNA maturation endonuclease Nob1
MIEVLKQALEALEYMSMTAERYVDNRIPEAAITAIKEALAQTEHNFCPRCGKRTKDIHTCTPPQRTEEKNA